jgi:uncharacterized protein YndB with AHSA1/START domain
MMRAGAWLMAAGMVLSVAGCTVYPEGKEQTLATTTSAEQVQRIFWQDVVAGKWDEVHSLLAPNVVWIGPGGELTRDEIVPHLQGLKVTQAQVGETAVKANGPDITVTFTLQFTAGGGPMVTRHVAAVWQRMEGKKAATPYLLTLNCDPGH